MSEKDQAQLDAEELLPCTDCGVSSEHYDNCPAFYRPTVAAKLRELREDSNVLKLSHDSWEHLARESNKDNTTLRAEVEKLKPPHADEDGACSRCGLSWDGEKDSNDVHVCPAGFWTKLETENFRLRIVNESIRVALADPPPDVQEAVIKKLDLVSRDALKVEAERVTERDCAAVCQGCNEKVPANKFGRHIWPDGTGLYCQALKIRAAAESED